MKKKSCHSRLEIAGGDFEMLEESLYLRTGWPTLAIPRGAPPGLNLCLDTELGERALCPPGRHLTVVFTQKHGSGVRGEEGVDMVLLHPSHPLELYFSVQLEY